MSNLSKEIVVQATEYGIEEKKLPELISNLPQIQSERDELSKQYDEVIKMDIESPETSKIARELRLRIRDNRTKGIALWHKNSKDYFLKGGQFVDAIKRKEEAINTRMEDALEEIEKYIQNKIAKEKEFLKDKRLQELKVYSDFVPFGLDFSELSEDEYKKVYNGAKLQYEADLIEKQKIEQERIEKERIEKISHQNKMALLPYMHFIDNWDSLVFSELIEQDVSLLIKTAIKEKQKKDEEAEENRKKAEEAERVIQEERMKAQEEKKKYEENLRKEQEEKRKLEEEIRQKKEEEERKIREEEEKKEMVKNFSDKQILLDMANNLSNFSKQYPEMKGKAAKQIIEELNAILNKTSSYIKQEANKITK